MKKYVLITSILFASIASHADSIVSKCDVSIKGTSVQTFLIQDGIGQGSIDDLDITVLLNDDSGASAQVGIDDKSTSATVVFYQATSSLGTFKFAAQYEHAGKNYSLMCTSVVPSK